MINRKGKEMEFGEELEVGRGKEKMQVSSLRGFLFVLLTISVFFKKCILLFGAGPGLCCGMQDL